MIASCPQQLLALQQDTPAIQPVAVNEYPRTKYDDFDSDHLIEMRWVPHPSRPLRRVGWNNLRHPEKVFVIPDRSEADPRLQSGETSSTPRRAFRR
jgi:hypothetical protein